MSVSAVGHPLLRDPDYQSLKHYLIGLTGLAYYADKDAELIARISARLRQLALSGCGVYLELLKNRHAGESERDLLIAQLTIGETYFFRHTEQFDALRDVVLPDVIARNQATRRLRIWSAGCAIGAEPYSVAILLLEQFADRVAGWDVQILGTDINKSFLARAGRGEFDERALRSTPEIKRDWCSALGRSWCIKPALKEMVTFQYHNLVEHPYPSIVHGIAALDVILCRNVMIYFDRTVIDRILDRFHECLVEGGWLAVGHAESNPELFRAYRTVNVPGATLYQKTGERRESGEPISPASIPDAPAWWPAASDPQPAWSPPVLPAIPELAGSVSDHPAPSADLAGVTLVRRLADEGKWTAAAAACEQWLEQDQLNPVVHFYQALILEQMHRDADAERAFRRALYLDRAFVLAHYHLALLLQKTGRSEDSRQSLRNVRTLLARMDKRLPIAEGDGLTVDDLGQLCDLHTDSWPQ